tara:strand:+ start:78 stop:218 length:141 start_codon:yes stop_codon:yes gene_type:complete
VLPQLIISQEIFKELLHILEKNAFAASIFVQFLYWPVFHQIVGQFV